jgi:hypothetical protein
VTCGAAFFLNGPTTESDTCQLPAGHAGPHVTGVSPVFDLAGVPTRMSISFGEKAPVDLRHSILEIHE